MLTRRNFWGLTKFAGISTVSGVGVSYFLGPKKKPINGKHVVLITGCDSGLGYNMALKCASLKGTVVACCLNLKSDGATKLMKTFSGSNQVHVIELDITDSASISVANQYVKNLIEKNDLEFTALVNNSGVMCFGETEWQTKPIIEQQIKVNLLGTILMTKEFLPLIRKHKGRIVNVTSHCGLRALPGLPVYGATKAGLKSFTEGLRLDMKKYGVDVVNFIPGSFVGSSNIAAKQQVYAQEMKKSFNNEQLDFYGSYFDSYNKYLQIISGDKEAQIIPDEKLMKNFEHALLDESPKVCYLTEPLRYQIYHLLFYITPQPISDWLIHKFVSLPKFQGKE